MKGVALFPWHILDWSSGFSLTTITRNRQNLRKRAFLGRKQRFWTSSVPLTIPLATSLCFRFAYSKGLLKKSNYSKGLLEKSNLLEMCVCTCDLSRPSSVAVKIYQVFIRPDFTKTRVLNLNFSADLSKDGWWKSRNLLSWQMKVSKPLVLANY